MKNMIKLIEKFLFWIYGNENLISNEGYKILSDPTKRKRLIEWIENYHKTGVWDYSFWDEK